MIVIVCHQFEWMVLLMQLFFVICLLSGKQLTSHVYFLLTSSLLSSSHSPQQSASFISAFLFLYSLYNHCFSVTEWINSMNLKHMLCKFAYLKEMLSMYLVFTSAFRFLPDGYQCIIKIIYSESCHNFLSCVLNNDVTDFLWNQTKPNL